MIKALQRDLAKARQAAYGRAALEAAHWIEEARDVVLELERRLRVVPEFDRLVVPRLKGKRPKSGTSQRS